MEEGPFWPPLALEHSRNNLPKMKDEVYGINLELIG